MFARIITISRRVLNFMRDEARLITRTLFSFSSLAVVVFYVSGWLFVLLISIIPYRIVSINEHLGFWVRIPDGLPRFFRGWSLVFGILSGLWWWCSAREKVSPSDINTFNKGAASSTAIAVVCSLAANDMSSRLTQLSALAVVVLVFTLSDEIRAAASKTRRELMAVGATALLFSIILSLYGSG